MVQLFVLRFTSESQKSEIQTKMFQFRTDLDNRTPGNGTKADCLKTEWVWISDVDCTNFLHPRLSVYLAET